MITRVRQRTLNPGGAVRIVHEIQKPKEFGARASFERAGVFTHTVSTPNEHAREFPYRTGSWILDRNRKALHNLDYWPDRCRESKGKITIEDFRRII
jgi:hypothetical protein